MGHKKRVLILVNRDFVIYNFRLELVQVLLEQGYEVCICSPEGPKLSKLIEMGCEYIPISMQRRGTNPFRDIQLMKDYRKIFEATKPDIILTYTTKVCIYGGIVARKMKIPYLMNVSGLGTALEKKGPLQPLMIFLYRMAAKNAQCVFFQNQENRKFFEKHNMYKGKSKLIPGSGVNLSKWKVLEYPDDKDGVEFLFVARIMKEKGIEEYVATAEAIKKDYPSAIFHVVGPCDGAYEDYLRKHVETGTIIYHGEVQDTQEFLARAHCTIHPSYYPEGMSNVLIESASSGRPVITTNRSGCRETVEHGVTGFMCEIKNCEQLIQNVRLFMEMDNEARKEMGLAGRRKMENEFNRQIVVDAYMKEIEE
ncbi:MAG: glycosyltransferase family 4 protein [Agathobacter sp.]|nr:glycosyltransferase family 4 protein [Agathobacter sp.]